MKKGLITSLSQGVDDFRHHSHKVQNVPWVFLFWFDFFLSKKSLFS